MKLKIKPLTTKWLPVLAWSSLIFYLSSLTSTPGGNWFMERIAPYLAHFVEYAILYYLLYRATRKTGLSFALAILYALSDEIHQSFVPGRVPDFLDILVDIIGMLGAFIIIKKSQILNPNHQMVRQAHHLEHSRKTNHKSQ